MTKANYDLGDDFVAEAETRANAHRKKPTDHLVMLNTRVPKDLRDRVKMASVKHGTSITAIVGEALETWLKEKDSAPEMNAFSDDSGDDL